MAHDPGDPPSLQEVIDDLALRFVVNCPPEEQESFERLLFQVEAAFWFYDDQYREIWPETFPPFNLLSFAQQMFKCCELLKPFEKQTKEIYEAFTQYKQSIPTCGAMLLNSNSTKVLLVRSWQGKSWGFPKGKIDRDEDMTSCAAREVLEEVGYDISAQIDPQAYVEMQIKHYPPLRLYVVRGVPDNTHFETRTKKEIGGIEWFKIQDIPTRKDASKAEPDTAKAKPFWMVAPYIAWLKGWLSDKGAATTPLLTTTPTTATATATTATTTVNRTPGSSPTLTPAPNPNASMAKTTTTNVTAKTSAASASATVKVMAHESKDKSGAQPAAPLNTRAKKDKRGSTASQATATPTPTIKVLEPPQTQGQVQPLSQPLGTGRRRRQRPARGHPFLDFVFRTHIVRAAIEG